MTQKNHGFNPLEKSRCKRLKSSTRGGQRSLTGFTLIELLVVIFIIGILTTIVTINVQSARQQGRDAKRKADMNSVAAALELYYSSNKQYPDIVNFSGSWDTLKTFMVPAYFSGVWPQDPLFPSQTYRYVSNSVPLGLPPGSAYVVEAGLESKTEPITITSINPDSNGDPAFYQSGVYDRSGKRWYRLSSPLAR